MYLLWDPPPPVLTCLLLLNAPPCAGLSCPASTMHAPDQLQHLHGYLPPTNCFWTEWFRRQRRKEGQSMSLLNFLSICNTVIIPISCPHLRILASTSVLQQFWLIYLRIMGHIFLLLCVIGDVFLLNVWHHKFYLIRCQIFFYYCKHSWPLF